MGRGQRLEIRVYAPNPAVWPSDWASSVPSLGLCSLLSKREHSTWVLEPHDSLAL